MRDAPFLPRRRSVRLKHFDYSQRSAYFLTICAYDRRSLFGKMIQGRVALNALGKIIEECWLNIPAHSPNVELVTHIVMPSHVHGIVVIRQQVASPGTYAHGEAIAKHLRRARHAVPLRPERGTRGFAAPAAGSIPTIVGAFKAAVSRQANTVILKPAGSLWQRGYYEHIIRNERDFRNACEYIRTNPARHALRERKETGEGKD